MDAMKVMVFYGPPTCCVVSMSFASYGVGVELTLLGIVSQAGIRGSHTP